ncbi:ABC transporter ATP-binding protein [Lacticaseibacillus daqingensis]|uniref:ABC transporter ATP-binding protein n=1 Tax=Lacticaseibacillus daqingensis TaxID=2486014 RepID=UPI000F77BB1C|nr:ABC transporter ATP-binding protein [Lacticaseibacillus daqingensis]
MAEPAIKVTGLTKRFGDFVANDHLDLTINFGEVHALLGENGAGKTTMMNMLSGILIPTSGTIEVRGKAAHLQSAKDATALGIGMVHQHFMLVENFSVIDNIILGAEPTKGGKIDRTKAKKDIMALSEKYRLRIEPDAKIEDISVGMQQRVEILKVLYRQADILIFDEPTAVLTPQEIDELLDIMRQLASEGKAVVLISHKLAELRQVADVITIIRRGKKIDTVPASTSTAELADKMVGRHVNFARERVPMPEGAPVLEVKDLVVEDKDKVAHVRDLSLMLRGGEILGLAGIDGNGQSEFVKAITGLLPVTAGQILIGGKDLTHATPREVTEASVGHIPEDRQRFGLVMPMDLVENMSLQTYYKPPLSHHGVMDTKVMVQTTEQLLDDYDVRHANLQQKAGDLSGGNQQKLIIARELSRDPQLVIAMNPTRGLDVGAIEFIHAQLLKARAAGHAVLLISFELDEVRQLSDRIAVIHNGHIVGESATSDLTEQQIGLMMTGETLEHAKEATHEN